MLNLRFHLIFNNYLSGFQKALDRGKLDPKCCLVNGRPSLWGLNLYFLLVYFFRLPHYEYESSSGRRKMGHEEIFWWGVGPLPADKRSTCLSCHYDISYVLGSGISFFQGNSWQPKLSFTFLSPPLIKTRAGSYNGEYKKVPGEGKQTVWLAPTPALLPPQSLFSYPKTIIQSH